LIQHAGREYLLNLAVSVRPETTGEPPTTALAATQVEELPPLTSYATRLSMKTILRRIPLSPAVLSIAAVFALQAGAEENRVTFPGNFAEYVRYGVFDRGSSGEEAFALPKTITISKNGLPLPNGTQLVLRILKNGELTSYFVMQKGEGWGADYDEERRTGDWQFQQFDTNMQVMTSTNTAQCQSCHSRAVSDAMYTIEQMRAFLP
jgi:hypothetical protein